MGEKNRENGKPLSIIDYDILYVSDDNEETIDIIKSMNSKKWQANKNGKVEMKRINDRIDKLKVIFTPKPNEKIELQYLIFKKNADESKSNDQNIAKIISQFDNKNSNSSSNNISLDQMKRNIQYKKVTKIQENNKLDSDTSIEGQNSKNPNAQKKKNKGPIEFSEGYYKMNSNKNSNQSYQEKIFNDKGKNKSNEKVQTTIWNSLQSNSINKQEDSLQKAIKKSLEEEEERKQAEKRKFEEQQILIVLDLSKKEAEDREKQLEQEKKESEYAIQLSLQKLKKINRSATSTPPLNDDIEEIQFEIDIKLEGEQSQQQQLQQYQQQQQPFKTSKQHQNNNIQKERNMPLIKITSPDKSNPSDQKSIQAQNYLNYDSNKKPRSLSTSPPPLPQNKAFALDEMEIESQLPTSNKLISEEEKQYDDSDDGNVNSRKPLQKYKIKQKSHFQLTINNLSKVVLKQQRDEELKRKVPYDIFLFKQQRLDDPFKLKSQNQDDKFNQQKQNQNAQQETSILKRQIFCVSGFTDSDSMFLQNLIEILGGIFSSRLDESCHFMIARSSKTRLYQIWKENKEKYPKLRVVNREFIVFCQNTGNMPNPSAFRLNLGCD